MFNIFERDTNLIKTLKQENQSYKIDAFNGNQHTTKITAHKNFYTKREYHTETFTMIRITNHVQI